MKLRALTGRTGRAVLLLVLGAVTDAAAAAGEGHRRDRRPSGCQIASPFFTNWAFVIDAVLDLVPPPQPAAISAIAATAARSTPACLT